MLIGQTQFWGHLPLVRDSLFAIRTNVTCVMKWYYHCKLKRLIILSYLVGAPNIFRHQILAETSPLRSIVQKKMMLGLSRQESAISQKKIILNHPTEELFCNWFQKPREKCPKKPLPSHLSCLHLKSLCRQKEDDMTHCFVRNEGL